MSIGDVEAHQPAAREPATARAAQQPRVLKTTDD